MILTYYGKMIKLDIRGPARVAAIGECMIERREEGTDLKSVPDIPRNFSGDTLNTLTYAARLLGKDRANLFYVTAVGEDEDSSAMLAAWEAEGINTGFARRLRYKLPGSYTIATGPDGERRFDYDRTGPLRVSCSGMILLRACKIPEGFHLVYLSGISFAILDNEYRESLLPY